MSGLTAQHLINAMEAIAPPELAEDWDNTGLILGDRTSELAGPVLLTIDLTEPVAEEAIGLGASAIVSYHPPVFEPLRSLTADNARGRALLAAAARSMVVYSPHTALDAAPGGMNDWLADGLLGEGTGATADRRALRAADEHRPSEQVKIVTFVPESALEDVRSALASAGAGRIGLYELCAFVSPGVGSFRALAGADPAVGRVGSLERVTEMRLEMVAPRRALAIAIETLKRFHPYEEPPIDIYDLRPRPMRDTGPGRRLHLDTPATLDELVARLKRHLGVPAVKVAEASDAPVSTIGVCAGSGGDLTEDALAQGCSAFVTGEMQHHDVLRATESGLSVLLCGHTSTERGYMPRLAERLAEEAPGLTCVVSQRDRSPFTLR